MKTFQTLIEQLIALGENRDEMEFWLSIFPNMEPQDQSELRSSLEREREALMKCAEKPPAQDVHSE